MAYANIAHGFSRPFGRFANHLWFEVFCRVLELDLLGDGDIVIAD
jgi:hypothetical protein